MLTNQGGESILCENAAIQVLKLFLFERYFKLVRHRSYPCLLHPPHDLDEYNVGRVHSFPSMNKLDLHIKSAGGREITWYRMPPSYLCTKFIKLPKIFRDVMLVGQEEQTWSKRLNPRTVPEAAMSTPLPPIGCTSTACQAIAIRSVGLQVPSCGQVASSALAFVSSRPMFCSPPPGQLACYGPSDANTLLTPTA
eukprot:1587695-Pyramimonas_sp.AAC.2